MHTLSRAIALHLAVGVFAAAGGALVGLLVCAVWPGLELPSATICAAVGAGFGFVTGTCFGNRNVEGRPSIILMGFLAGTLVGSTVGHLWGRVERAVVAHQIESLGRYPNNKGGGVSARGYDDIGVRFGICWGAVAGFAAGCEWNRRRRFVRAAAIIPACIVVAGIWEMNAAFRAENSRQISMSHGDMGDATTDQDKKNEP